MALVQNRRACPMNSSKVIRSIAENVARSATTMNCARTGNVSSVHAKTSVFITILVSIRKMQYQWDLSGHGMQTNFHIYSNACEADSTTNCGTHGIQCNVANADNVCVSKSCTFTCHSNYHLYNDACEADSKTNYGAHGTSCGSGRRCDAGESDDR